jgi:Rrf2 family protein
MNMLSSKTRLSVKVMVGIASAPPSETVTVQALSTRLHVSVSHLESITGTLRQAGLIRSMRGPGGGYHMACDPQTVTIWDVVRRVDPAFQQPAAPANSPIASLEASIHETFVAFLSSHTIAEFVTADLARPTVRSPPATGLRPNPMLRTRRPSAPNSVFELGAYPLLRAA